MSEVEFICEWFQKAADGARKQHRFESAVLWEDGLKTLRKQQKELQEAYDCLGRVVTLQASSDGAPLSHCDNLSWQVEEARDFLKEKGRLNTEEGASKSSSFHFNDSREIKKGAKK